MMMMMKIAHAYPRQQWHVSILLTHTCLNHPSGTGSSTIYPPKLITADYKCTTRGASCQTQTQTKIRYSHSYSRSHTKINTTETLEMAEQGGGDYCDQRQKLRSEFLQVLSSRRTSQVPLTVEIAKPVLNSPPPTTAEEIMKSCPRFETKEGGLKEENLYLNIEEGDHGRLPLLILSLKQQSDQQPTKRPAVVFLHSSGEHKETMRPLLEAYASRGYVAISPDSRYHGERASTSSKTSYQDGLIDAWKNGKTMPFIYDTVWDMIKLADYLTQREDIDPSRIGITGVSLGGMHAWFTAFADTRYAVVAPMIGVQGFRWAIDNDKWHARVGSKIKPVFEVARDDLGKSAIDKEVVEKVWDRIAPGLASQFDSPYTIPCIAPRPLLILNSAEDPRCPLGGLEVAVSNTLQAYKELDALDHFKFIAEPEVGHEITPFQVKEAAAWFDRFLKP